MAEKIFIVDSREAGLDAATARRQFTLSLAVGFAVLAAAAIVEFQPARVGARSLPRSAPGRRRAVSVVANYAFARLRASSATRTRTGVGAPRRADRRNRAHGRRRRRAPCSPRAGTPTARDEIPRRECAAARSLRPRARAARRSMSAISAVSPIKRARLDAPLGAVDGELERARQHEDRRRRPDRRARTASRRPSASIGAGEGDQLHRLARQQVEGASARHPPDVGFEAHRAKLSAQRS